MSLSNFSNIIEMYYPEIYLNDRLLILEISFTFVMVANRFLVNCFESLIFDIKTYFRASPGTTLFLSLLTQNVGFILHRFLVSVF